MTSVRLPLDKVSESNRAQKALERRERQEAKEAEELAEKTFKESIESWTRGRELYYEMLHAAEYSQKDFNFLDRTINQLKESIEQKVSPRVYVCCDHPFRFMGYCEFLKSIGCEVDGGMDLSKAARCVAPADRMPDHQLYDMVFVEKNKTSYPVDISITDFCFMVRSSDLQHQKRTNFIARNYICVIESPLKNENGELCTIRDRGADLSFYRPFYRNIPFVRELLLPPMMKSLKRLKMRRSTSNFTKISGLLQPVPPELPGEREARLEAESNGHKWDDGGLITGRAIEDLQDEIFYLKDVVKMKDKEMDRIRTQARLDAKGFDTHEKEMESMVESLTQQLEGKDADMASLISVINNLKEQNKKLTAIGTSGYTTAALKMASGVDGTSLRDAMNAKKNKEKQEQDEAEADSLLNRLAEKNTNDRESRVQTTAMAMYAMQHRKEAKLEEVAENSRDVQCDIFHQSQYDELHAQIETLQQQVTNLTAELQKKQKKGGGKGKKQKKRSSLDEASRLGSPSATEQDLASDSMIGTSPQVGSEEDEDDDDPDVIIEKLRTQLKHALENKDQMYLQNINMKKNLSELKAAETTNAKIIKTLEAQVEQQKERLEFAEGMVENIKFDKGVYEGKRINNEAEVTAAEEKAQALQEELDALRSSETEKREHLEEQVNRHKDLAANMKLQTKAEQTQKEKYFWQRCILLAAIGKQRQEILAKEGVISTQSTELARNLQASENRPVLVDVGVMTGESKRKGKKGNKKGDDEPLTFTELEQRVLTLQDELDDAKDMHRQAAELLNPVRESLAETRSELSEAKSGFAKYKKEAEALQKEVDSKDDTIQTFQEIVQAKNVEIENLKMKAKKSQPGGGYSGAAAGAGSPTLKVGDGLSSDLKTPQRTPLSSHLSPGATPHSPSLDGKPYNVETRNRFVQTEPDSRQQHHRTTPSSTRLMNPSGSPSFSNPSTPSAAPALRPYCETVETQTDATASWFAMEGAMESLEVPIGDSIKLLSSGGDNSLLGSQMDLQRMNAETPSGMTMPVTPASEAAALREHLISSRKNINSAPTGTKEKETLIINRIVGEIDTKQLEELNGVIAAKDGEIEKLQSRMKEMKVLAGDLNANMKVHKEASAEHRRKREEAEQKHKEVADQLQQMIHEQEEKAKRDAEILELEKNAASLRELAVEDLQRFSAQADTPLTATEDDGSVCWVYNAVSETMGMARRFLSQLQSSNAIQHEDGASQTFASMREVPELAETEAQTQVVSRDTGTYMVPTQYFECEVQAVCDNFDAGVQAGNGLDASGSSSSPHDPPAQRTSNEKPPASPLQRLRNRGLGSSQGVRRSGSDVALSESANIEERTITTPSQLQSQREQLASRTSRSSMRSGGSMTGTNNIARKAVEPGVSVPVGFSAAEALFETESRDTQTDASIANPFVVSALQRAVDGPGTSVGIQSDITMADGSLSIGNNRSTAAKKKASRSVEIMTAMHMGVSDDPRFSLQHHSAGESIACDTSDLVPAVVCTSLQTDDTLWKPATKAVFVETDPPAKVHTRFIQTEGTSTSTVGTQETPGISLATTQTDSTDGESGDVKEFLERSAQTEINHLEVVQALKQQVEFVEQQTQRLQEKLTRPGVTLKAQEKLLMNFIAAGGGSATAASQEGQQQDGIGSGGSPKKKQQAASLKESHCQTEPEEVPPPSKVGQAGALLHAVVHTLFIKLRSMFFAAEMPLIAHKPTNTAKQIIETLNSDRIIAQSLLDKFTKLGRHAHNSRYGGGAAGPAAVPPPSSGSEFVLPPSRLSEEEQDASQSGSNFLPPVVSVDERTTSILNDTFGAHSSPQAPPPPPRVTNSNKSSPVRRVHGAQEDHHVGVSPIRETDAKFEQRRQKQLHKLGGRGGQHQHHHDDENISKSLALLSSNSVQGYQRSLSPTNTSSSTVNLLGGPASGSVVTTTGAADPSLPPMLQQLITQRQVEKHEQQLRLNSDGKPMSPIEKIRKQNQQLRHEQFSPTGAASRSRSPSPPPAPVFTQTSSSAGGNGLLGVRSLQQQQQRTTLPALHGATSPNNGDDDDYYFHDDQDHWDRRRRSPYRGRAHLSKSSQRELKAIDKIFTSYEKRAAGEAAIVEARRRAQQPSGGRKKTRSTSVVPPEQENSEFPGGMVGRRTPQRREASSPTFLHGNAKTPSPTRAAAAQFLKMGALSSSSKHTKGRGSHLHQHTQHQSQGSGLIYVASRTPSPSMMKGHTSASLSAHKSVKAVPVKSGSKIFSSSMSGGARQR